MQMTAPGGSLTILILLGSGLGLLEPERGSQVWQGRADFELEGAWGWRRAG